MITPLICRHFLGLPCTRRNLERARSFQVQALLCVFASLVGLICWPLVYPVVVMWLAL
jgi:hypothetical protein